MKSKSEVGHAKNLANLNVINTIAEAQEENYNPSNPSITVPELKLMYTSLFNLQKAVNVAHAPYTLAVDSREALFTPLSKNLTKLVRFYSSTYGVTKAQEEDLQTIIRKLTGRRKHTTPKNTDETTESKKHSVSELSYDKRTNNMDELISLLENTPNYNPNEEEFKVSTYIDMKDKMLIATENVNSTKIALDKSRDARNKAFYTKANNLIENADKARNYLLSILLTNSSEYKSIMKLKFVHF